VEIDASGVIGESWWVFKINVENWLLGEVGEIFDIFNPMREKCQ
jgi:hypothetical protein